VDVKFEIVLFVRSPTVPFAPLEIPVIAPPPVIVDIVLPDAKFKPQFKFIIVTAEVPPVILVNVLLFTFLVGPPPSVFDQPAIVVAPVTVIFQKLLLLLLI
jgi:hypothetical protein